MRIISLLPSATEIVYALGLGDALVGVTHECDYPPAAQTKRVVTRSLLDHDAATSREIDSAVTVQLESGLGLYALDEAALAALRPDVILTQALCAVCAVAYDVVQQAVRDVSAQFNSVSPQVLSLEPTSLEDILQTILQVGVVMGRAEPAAEIVARLRARIERVQVQAAGVRRHPRVACLEWINPLFGPGHWLPELVQLAGGRPGLGQPHQAARQIAWSDIIAFAPEVIVIMPCGFGVQRAVEEALLALPHRAGWEALPAVRAGRVYAVDANAYFSRPGPRIVDSLELLAELIHPDRFAGWGPRDAWVTLPVVAAS